MTRRVLVVDDDKDSAGVLVLLLEHDGHEVHSCRDGRSALETAVRIRPDVAILDLRLGDMSGLHVALALRESEETAAAVLVALTGLEGEAVRQRCCAAGFDCHVVKPIPDFARFRELVGTLEVPQDLRLS